jgi:hypothetical protein
LALSEHNAIEKLQFSSVDVGADFFKNLALVLKQTKLKKLIMDGLRNTPV